MAMFSENQSRQLYVATSTSADVIAPVQVDGSATPAVKATDLKAKSAGACQFIVNVDGTEAYLNYKGATDDGLQRSDLIKKCNVIDVRCTDAADMLHKMKKVEVTLNSSVSATPVIGQDYVLNINIKNYVANGDDSIKVKFGAAKATNETASDLYKALAINVAKNFGREPVALISVSLKTASDPVAITDKTKIADLSSVTATGIIIEEVEQPWRLGAAKVEYVNFEVLPSTIFTGGLDQIWGTVTDVTSTNSNTLSNAKIVADMEYFYHKNRGDIYGFQDWPNNIDTKYLVNPANTDGYSFVDIHFYYEGNSHNIGHSEKTITIVGTKANLKKLIGNAYVPADDPDPAVPATGLYAFLEGTGVTIKTSDSWNS
jgi:hypothetical protein